jgi:hypothetical protein
MSSTQLGADAAGAAGVATIPERFDARERGTSPDEASAVADRYMAEVKHIVVSRT